MPFWRRSPKAATYPGISALPNPNYPAAKKRAEDLEITLRRIAPPVEANPNDKKNHGIDSWDFVTPGDSEEEVELVAKIIEKCYTRPEDDSSVGEDEGVIYRAGFSESEPATYRWFIAEYGTREEIIGESYGLERYFGCGDSPIKALKMLAHKICDQRDRNTGRG